MFAVHVLAPFALTTWTSALLERAAPSRVINVSCGGMYPPAAVVPEATGAPAGNRAARERLWPTARACFERLGDAEADDQERPA